ncbi:MAG TPA: crossover junction endodeoxyribonuclease RuvC [Clostridiales bacterium]|jgi:crossover junction endodeoxyribonuclease RuvC|nr:crossover junction endodeoxyribonuclease RuvC [Clostridiales bacterium]
MRIIGIDPGYAIMGYGIVDQNGNQFRPVAYGCITTDKDQAMPDRLKRLYEGLTEIIADYQPEEASVEQLFFNTNVTTAIQVGQARGVAILACANSGLPVFEYTPLQIKTSLTGYGRAQKEQMQSMTKMLLGLESVPRPDDAADALAAALCHGYAGPARKRYHLLK